MASKQSQKPKLKQPQLPAKRFPTPAATASDPDIQSQSGTSSDENGRKPGSKNARQSDASSSTDTYFGTSSSSENSSDEEPLCLKRPAGHAIVRRSAVQKQTVTEPHRKASTASITAIRALVRYEKAARERIADPNFPDDIELHDVVRKLKQQDIAENQATEKAHHKRMRQERRLQRLQQQQHGDGGKEVDNDSRENIQSYRVSGPEVEARKAAYRKKYKFAPHKIKIKIKPFEPRHDGYPVDPETGLRRVKGMGFGLKSCPYIYGGEDGEGRTIWLSRENMPTTNAVNMAD